MQNDVESIRLRTNEYEMIIAQHGNFTIIATQASSNKAESKAAGGSEEKKEGGEDKKEAA